MGEDMIRNFGVVIAICGALFVFGGETFAIWTFGLEADYGSGDEITIDLKFGADEIVAEYDGDDMPDDESFGYDDDECTVDDDGEYEECKELGSFFSNLKIMFYALIVCGIGLAYIGNSGENMESIPTVAGVTALLSVAILAYTFMTLPEAFEEDTELFESVDEEPAFFVNAERDDDGGDLHWKAMPHVGYFLPIVSLTLAGLLVRPEWLD